MLRNKFKIAICIMANFWLATFFYRSVRRFLTFMEMGVQTLGKKSEYKNQREGVAVDLPNDTEFQVINLARKYKKLEYVNIKVY